MPESKAEKQKTSLQKRLLPYGVAAVALAVFLLCAVLFGFVPVLLFLLQFIGWTLLTVVVIVLVVILCPVIIGVKYESKKMVVWVRFLGIKINVYPLSKWMEKIIDNRKNKKPKQKKKKKKEEDKEETQEKTTRNWRAAIEKQKKLAVAIKDALGVFFWHIRVRNVRLCLPVHAEDAADTAMRCGQVQAAIGTMRAMLEGRVHVQYKQLEVVPDFTGDLAQAVFFTCKVSLKPVIIVMMSIKFLQRWLQKRPYSKKVYKQAIKAKRRRQKMYNKMRRANASKK